MPDLEEIKKMLEHADIETDKGDSKAELAARKVVNIERQAFYGGQSSAKRLGLIREVIAEYAEEARKNEA
ncbi:MAG: hypothetical protein C9356_02630 [Oleiphilus sp.]|nr:MAG: hypothetical protein C9356_02630 [Oleiphilus sp.]